MLKNSKRSMSGTTPGSTPAAWRNPRFVMRALLGVLVGANLIAAGLLLWPIGGSAEDLERERVRLLEQVRKQQVTLERSRQNAAAVEKARTEGDGFLSEYFLTPRTAYSTLISELLDAAAKTKIQAKEHAYSVEGVEGSDTLNMMTITANYEGSYSDLLHFVNAVDRSPRLLIIESLNAVPQQGTTKLAVNMKLNTFVRGSGEGGGGQ